MENTETTEIVKENYFTRLWNSGKKAYARFIKLRGNPQEIALGFALGIFVGMSPTMGIQMVIAICLASLIGWNSISAAMAVWITNPLSAPLIYSFTYYTGAQILSYDMSYHLPQELSLEALLVMIKVAPKILWVMTVGGIVWGIPLAVLSYYLSLAIIINYRQGLQKTIAIEKKLITRISTKTKSVIKTRHRADTLSTKVVTNFFKSLSRRKIKDVVKDISLPKLLEEIRAYHKKHFRT